jgi:hypothetical protein
MAAGSPDVCAPARQRIAVTDRTAVSWIYDFDITIIIL